MNHSISRAQATAALGEPVLITVVIGAASLFVTVVGYIAYRHNGSH